MDEPLSNLDAQLRVEMRREIRALQRRLGMTMLYVTHDQVEAMTMADQVVLMRNGRIEQDAAPAALYERPATIFAARFVGTPPMNVIPAALVAGRISRDRRSGRARDTLAVGIRPEAARLGADGVPRNCGGGRISRRRHADRDAPRAISPFIVRHRRPRRTRARSATRSASAGSRPPRTGSICHHSVASIDNRNTIQGRNIMDRRQFLSGTAALAERGDRQPRARARRPKSRSSIRSRSAARSPRSSTAMRPTSRRPTRRSR